MKKITKITVLLISVFLFGLGGCRKNDVLENKKKGESFSAVVLGDKGHRTINKNTFHGKVVLLSFWATWCPPCIKEIPVLTKIRDDYSAKGFELVGMNIDTDDLARAEKAVSHFQVNYTLALADNAMQKKYGVNGVPYKVLLDRNGNIRATYRGNVSEEQMRCDIQKLL